MAFDNTLAGGFMFPQSATQTGGYTKVEGFACAYICAWIQASGRLPTTDNERDQIADLAIQMAKRTGVKVTSYETT